MPLTDDEADYVLNNFVTNRLSGTKYVALFNGEPLNGGVEVSGNAYARATAPSWGAAGGRVVASTNACVFATPSPSDWGTVTHFAIMNHLTDTGEAATIAIGELAAPLSTSSGVAPVFQTGALRLIVP